LKITKFEEIIAWQKSQDFAVNVYEILEPLKDYDFKRQIQRASVSISNNIAEGFERGTNPDFKRFLFIALASNSEVKSMLYLALRLKFISQTDFGILYTQSVEISKIISGFIKSLK
jgi:four helix bundle protein